ncbi:hypothetical protein D3C84_645010 [compost metagenome]
MTGPNRRFFNDLSVRQKPLTGFGLVLTITQLVAALLIAQLIVVPLRQAVQQARKVAKQSAAATEETSAASIDLARWAGSCGPRSTAFASREGPRPLTAQTTGGLAARLPMGCGNGSPAEAAIPHRDMRVRAPRSDSRSASRASSTLLPADPSWPCGFPSLSDSALGSPLNVAYHNHSSCTYQSR